MALKQNQRRVLDKAEKGKMVEQMVLLEIGMVFDLQDSKARWHVYAYQRCTSDADLLPDYLHLRCYSLLLNSKGVIKQWVHRIKTV